MRPPSLRTSNRLAALIAIVGALILAALVYQTEAHPFGMARGAFGAFEQAVVDFHDKHGRWPSDPHLATKNHEIDEWFWKLCKKSGFEVAFEPAKDDNLTIRYSGVVSGVFGPRPSVERVTLRPGQRVRR